jgi:hypothetical protein
VGVVAVVGDAEGVGHMEPGSGEELAGEVDDGCGDVGPAVGDDDAAGGVAGGDVGEVFQAGPVVGQLVGVAGQVDAGGEAEGLVVGECDDDEAVDGWVADEVRDQGEQVFGRAQRQGRQRRV